MRVALVHEYLNQFGGAERVLQILSSIFPDAPIYTLFYDAETTGRVFEGKEIRTSFLQKVPLVRKNRRLFPLFMPVAIEQFDFSNFDLVLSVSASFAKGVITGPGTKHICYCLTPPRFLWDDSQKFVDEFGYPKFIKNLFPPLITYLRLWDKEASFRVDEFWAISNFVKNRIKKYYAADADVIYPPVDTSKFKIWNHSTPVHNAGSEKFKNPRYFLMVGRLVSYKKFDLVVKAFSKISWPLKIVGIGPELKKLKEICYKLQTRNIEFLGQVSDEKLVELYSNAEALIFPQEEDFGITALESMASGRPVIAYRGGGALETIVENVTGLFFNEQTPESLLDALGRFKNLKFKTEDCRNQAEKFSVNVFREKILAKVGGGLKHI